MAIVETHDLLELLELRKIKAELEFKKGYLDWKGSSDQVLRTHLTSELFNTDSKIEKLEKKLDSFELILPDHDLLNELNSKFNSESKDSIYGAMKAKEGEVFELIKKRGEVLKKIYSQKEEIAQMNKTINSLPKSQRELVVSMLQDKDQFDEEKLKTISDGSTRDKISRLFSRLGYEISTKSEEEKVTIGSKSIWVPQNLVQKVETLNRDMETLSKKIQFLNAQRQIKKFSELEDAEFNKTQNSYLSLLKEQDKLISDFGY